MIYIYLIKNSNACLKSTYLCSNHTGFMQKTFITKKTLVLSTPHLCSSSFACGREALNLWHSWHMLYLTNTTVNVQESPPGSQFLCHVLQVIYFYKIILGILGRQDTFFVRPPPSPPLAPLLRGAPLKKTRRHGLQVLPVVTLLILRSR